MADDELRALARTLETRPDDLEAALAYARALARAGDERGERREAASLAVHEDALLVLGGSRRLVRVAAE